MKGDNFFDNGEADAGAADAGPAGGCIVEAFAEAVAFDGAFLFVEPDGGEAEQRHDERGGDQESGGPMGLLPHRPHCAAAR